MDFIDVIVETLLNLLFGGFFDLLTTVLTTVIFGVVDVFNRGVTDLFATDLSWFNATFPMVKNLQTVILAMAVSLAILLCIWQLFRSMGGSIVGDVEEPWIIVIRTCIFVFLIFYSQQLCDWALDFATGFYNQINTASMNGSWADSLKQIYESGSLIPESQDFSQIENESKVNEAIFNLALGFINWIFESLLGIILLIPIIWNYFKLLLETAERYVTMCIMYYSAPLALSMGASKSTSNITKSWTRMYGCSLLMLILSAWSLKLFASAIQSSVGTVIASRGNFFIWCLTLYGFLKAAQHLDEYLSAMGLSVAKTGGALLDDVMGTYSTLSHAFQNSKNASHAGNKEHNSVGSIPSSRNPNRSVMSIPAGAPGSAPGVTVGAPGVNIGTVVGTGASNRQQQNRQNSQSSTGGNGKIPYSGTGNTRGTGGTGGSPSGTPTASGTPSNSSMGVNKFNPSGTSTFVPNSPNVHGAAGDSGHETNGNGINGGSHSNYTIDETPSAPQNNGFNSAVNNVDGTFNIEGDLDSGVNTMYTGLGGTGETGENLFDNMSEPGDYSGTTLNDSETTPDALSPNTNDFYSNYSEFTENELKLDDDNDYNPFDDNSFDDNPSDDNPSDDNDDNPSDDNESKDPFGDSEDFEFDDDN